MQNADQHALSSDDPGDREHAAGRLALPGIVPCTVIRPPRRWPGLELRELWRYRELLHSLANRDVKLRYRQTALGVAWVVLQPLAAAAILAFVFGSVAGLGTDGMPVFLFVFSGLVVWNLFANVVLRANASIVSHAGIISKVYFPRLVLPISCLYSALLDFFVAGTVLGGLMALNGIVPTPRILFLPIWLSALVVLGLAIGTLGGAIAVRFRDVNHVVPVALQLVLYASPVAYAASNVPESMRSIYFLNPIAGVLEACRWSLFGTGEPSVLGIVYPLAFSLVFLFASFALFRRMEQQFADVI